MRAIVFVDHDIGHRLLRSMLGHSFDSQLEVRGVVTTEENGSAWWPGVSGLASRNNLPLLRYPRDQAAVIDFAEIDLFLLLSWKHLVPAAMLRQPRVGTVNLHYSLLPKYRGVYPVNWALVRGEKETGITYHWVNERIDSGAVICQNKISIAPDDTARSLQLKLDDLAFDTFPDVIRSVATGPCGSNESLDTSPTQYFSGKDFLDSNEINLDATVRTGDFLNLLRGKTFQPHGRNAFFIDPESGRKIYVSVELKAED